MSRIGKLPIIIPQGVEARVEGMTVLVKGPKGEFKTDFKKGVQVAVQDNQIVVSRENEIKSVRSMHGAIRNIINNAVTGVCNGFEKNLQLIGTGYRVKMTGKDLEFSLGFSHPIIFKAPEGIVFVVDGQDKLKVVGIDRQLVGQTAAEIRGLRPPEPYKGKGIRYQDEYVARKAGKAAKSE
ncbi:50S ribosomal protein L6 [Candidatus Beckwithbacteria bacterium]|nr:50S ribosomal protein L6 [Candidatus Beckwithbacteria bacterium]